MFAVAFSLVLATTSEADAETRPPGIFRNLFGPSVWRAASTEPHPAVVRVVAHEHHAHAQGSGTLVDVQDDCGLVITNWHVIRDATGEIVVYFPDGFASQARVLKVDKDWDLAALVIWKPKVEPVTIAATAPQPGDPLTIAGYGSGKYRAAAGRCTQYVAPGTNMPFEMVEVSTEARQGDSGGPIFNQRGELAGVLFGAGGGSTSGSYSRRVRGFLASVAPNLASPEPALVARHDAALAATSVADSASVPNSTNSQIDSLASAGQPQTRSNELRAAPPLLPLATSAASNGFAAKPGPNSQPVSASDSRSRPVTGYSTDYLSNTSTPPEMPMVETGAGPDWQTLFGHTPLEQGKSILALVGILAVVLRFLRPAAGRR